MVAVTADEAAHSFPASGGKVPDNGAT